MKNTTKRLMHIQFNHYNDIEKKLEKMGLEGLFLEKASNFLWTFRKGEPKKVHYTVTYFSEGSLFNPSPTENQLTYFQFAEQSGWKFITEFNQMQIFCNKEVNPVPFETDEGEKLANIKKCMKKSFIPSMLLLIAVFSLNIGVQVQSINRSPIDFLSDNFRLFPVVMFSLMVIYDIYLLVCYYIWCRSSEKSIALGGGCTERPYMFHKTIDILFAVFTISMSVIFIMDVVAHTTWYLMAYAFLLFPLALFVYFGSIKLMKKINITAKVNRIVSILLLIATTIAYMFGLFSMGPPSGGPYDSKPHRIVNWISSSGSPIEEKIFSDDIPLKCEDLYDVTDYENYSYLAFLDDSLFLTSGRYRQDSLPPDDAPPQLDYTIIEPKFDFVYEIVKNNLKKIPEWSSNSIEQIDNDIFGTLEAYEFFYDGGNPTVPPEPPANNSNTDSVGNESKNEYLLCYEDKIILIDLENPPTEEQIAIITEKLWNY